MPALARKTIYLIDHAALKPLAGHPMQAKPDAQNACRLKGHPSKPGSIVPSQLYIYAPASSKWCNALAKEAWERLALFSSGFPRTLSAQVWFYRSSTGRQGKALSAYKCNAGPAGCSNRPRTRILSLHAWAHALRVSCIYTKATGQFVVRACTTPRCCLSCVCFVWGSHHLVPAYAKSGEQHGTCAPVMCASAQRSLQIHLHPPHRHPARLCHRPPTRPLCRPYKNIRTWFPS